jgi:hypothetical protein
MRVTALLLAAILLSCKAEPVTRAEVPGLYVLESGGVTDTIQILPGGDYQHTRWDKNRRILNESGSWATAMHPDGPAIEFSRFTTFQPPAGPAVRGFWLSLVGRDHKGRITLDVNSDLDLNFTRVR